MVHTLWLRSCSDISLVARGCFVSIRIQKSIMTGQWSGMGGSVVRLPARKGWLQRTRSKTNELWPETENHVGWSTTSCV